MAAEQQPAQQPTQQPAQQPAQHLAEQSAGRELRRRRRANTSGEKRTVVQSVYLTRGERERLRERAAAAGVTVPRLLVEGALSDRPAVGELRQVGMELMAAHTDLSRAAVNMNQVARKANTVHEVPSDFTATLRELRGYAQRLDAAVAAVISALGPAAGRDHDRGPEQDSASDEDWYRILSGLGSEAGA